MNENESEEHERQVHERKFDPDRAAVLEDLDRQRFLPNTKIVQLLALSGTETVIDYGAGTGALSVELGRALAEGTVYAVEENVEMARLLQQKLSDAGMPRVHPLVIEDNQVPLADGSAYRVLAVNLLHEVVGENALEEMRRLLSPEGLLLVVDWDAEIERDQGPPAHVALSPEQGRRMLEEAGFTVESIAQTGFPYHYALAARK